MNKLYLTSCLLAILALPAFANIDKDASTATCDSATIGATSGTAYMDTDWTANTINLQWYSNGEQIDVSGTDSATCTYDDVITLPSTPQVPTGYTFGGWKVRVAPAGFDLSTLDASIPGSSYSYIKFDGTASTVNSSGTRKAASAHNITENGEWAVEFSYGTVKGIARCSLVGSGMSMGQNGNPTDYLNTEGAQYCWCQVTGFDDDKDGTYQSVVSSLWAFSRDYGSAADCASYCTINCGDRFRNGEALRAGLIGSVAQ